MKNRSKALAALALAGTLVLNPMKATANTINNYDLSTSADEENQDSVDNIFSENSEEEYYSKSPKNKKKNSKKKIHITLIIIKKKKIKTIIMITKKMQNIIKTMK